jgi:hypothetical protein
VRRTSCGTQGKRPQCRGRTSRISERRRSLFDHLAGTGRIDGGTTEPKRGGRSPSGCPRCTDPHRIERSARRHKQAALAITPEANIGATLRQFDAPDRGTGLIEDHHAVEAIEGLPTPQITVHIEAQAVSTAFFVADEHAPVGEPRAVPDHVIGADRGWH